MSTTCELDSPTHHSVWSHLAFFSYSTYTIEYSFTTFFIICTPHQAMGFTSVYSRWLSIPVPIPVPGWHAVGAQ